MPPSLSSVLSSGPFYATFKGMFGASCTYEYEAVLEPSKRLPDTRMRMAWRATHHKLPSGSSTSGSASSASTGSSEHRQHVLLQKIHSRLWIAVVQSTFHRNKTRKQIHSPPLTMPIEYKEEIGAWVMTGSFDAIKALFTVEGAPEIGFGILALTVCTSATVQFFGRLGSARQGGGLVISCYGVGGRLVTQAKVDEKSEVSFADQESASSVGEAEHEQEFSTSGLPASGEERKVAGAAVGTGTGAEAGAGAVAKSHQPSEAEMTTVHHPLLISSSSVGSVMQSIGQFTGIGFLKQQ
jgi:hypothetical protein